MYYQDDHNTQRIVDSNRALQDEVRRQREEMQRQEARRLNREFNSWLTSGEGQFSVAQDVQSNLIARLSDPVGLAKNELFSQGAKVIGTSILVEVATWYFAATSGISRLTPVAWVFVIVGTLGPVVAIFMYFANRQRVLAEAEEERSNSRLPENQRRLASLEAAARGGYISAEVDQSSVDELTRRRLR